MSAAVRGIDSSTMSNGGEVDRPEFWDALYSSGEAGWDLGTPTPVFIRLLESREFPPGRMLVPGCGTGHDAVAFARAGFRVTGVDFASGALAQARALAAAQGVPVEFIEADFFSLGQEYGGAFDYVLEHVTYCAIDPSRRPEYARAMSSLLKPGGRLIALFFPVEVRPQGPPFGVDMDEVERLLQPAFALLRSEIPVASIRPRRDREVLTIWERRL
jgi:methyl halide transferase